MSSKNAYFGVALAAAVSIGFLAYQVFGSSSSEEKKNEEGNRSNNPINDLPVIDFSFFFDKDVDPVRYEAECQKVAFSLHHFGLVVLKDPRVSESDNDRFLTMMEKYFELSDGIRDARPDLSYQIGVTGEKIERARDHCKTISKLQGDDKPLSPCPPIFDHKWRFFWRIGPIPEKTEFPVQNTEVVIPPEFPEWKEVMNMWGQKMSDATFTLAEMVAVGFEMPADSFTSRMKCGPHLLAPTGSDFNKYGQLGTVLAGFHYDLNFLTIHGKSRFPGLDVWTREGKRVSVTVPDGCLLVQAGKQIEYLTGGHVLAGFHEVIVKPSTLKVIEDKKRRGESLWRVSSTLFSHIQSDQVLAPLPPFNTTQSIASFPPVKAGNQVLNELKAISLSRDA